MGPQVCSVSVLDSSFPGITFDSSGVSDRANMFIRSTKARLIAGEANSDRLWKLAERIRHRGKGREFDSILGLSGGLDSSYLLHLAVRELGLRPLVFHVDGGWNSEVSTHNITALVKSLGLDLFTYVVDWESMRDFQLAFFRSGVPHLDVPQDHSFVAALYKFASEYKIPFILNGGNLATEGIRNPLHLYYYGTDMLHLRDIISKHSDRPITQYPFSSVFWHKVVLPYVRRIQVVKPLNLTRFRKESATELLAREYGWKSYPQKHFESRFTRFFEGYWLPERFGFDPRTVQLSSLVLTDQISRDTAIRTLGTRPLSQLEIETEKRYISSKLEIDVGTLEEFFTLEKRYFSDYKNRAKLISLGSRIAGLVGTEEAPKI